MSDPGPSRSPRGLLLLTTVISFLLVGCSAEVAVIATPVSEALFTEGHLTAAKDRGVGRVILVPPGDPRRSGFLRPGIGDNTALLLMPDVEPEAVEAVRGRSRLILSVDGENRESGVLALDRRPAFARLGELLGDQTQNDLESGGEDAETITVRVFALRDSEERVEEMQALLEPLRRRVPTEAIVVDEVAPGFSAGAVRERLREAGPRDPVLLFLGDAGGELLSDAVNGERLVAGETLFVPAQAALLGSEGGPKGEDMLLLGVDPVELFEATKEGETARLEARLFTVPALF
ncbi:MAG: hypothetical protein ACLFQZ_09605 [Spirochaetaceae bacterium]